MSSLSFSHLLQWVRSLMSLELVQTVFEVLQRLQRRSIGSCSLSRTEFVIASSSGSEGEGEGEGKSMIIFTAELPTCEDGLHLLLEGELLAEGDGVQGHGFGSSSALHFLLLLMAHHLEQSGRSFDRLGLHRWRARHSHIVLQFFAGEMVEVVAARHGEHGGWRHGCNNCSSSSLWRGNNVYKRRDLPRRQARTERRTSRRHWPLEALHKRAYIPALHLSGFVFLGGTRAGTRGRRWRWQCPRPRHASAPATRDESFGGGGVRCCCCCADTCTAATIDQGTSSRRSCSRAVAPPTRHAATYSPLTLCSWCRRSAYIQNSRVDVSSHCRSLIPSRCCTSCRSSRYCHESSTVLDHQAQYSTDDYSWSLFSSSRSSSTPLTTTTTTAAAKPHYV